MFARADPSWRRAARAEMTSLKIGLAALVVWTLASGGADAEILTPPYFNLAEGRQIKADATCGDKGPELYCKLVGANAENDENINVIQGQVCDYCDMSMEGKRHPPEYAVDGMETWWQSPPLSRGMKYNEINLTIDLGQEFHVAYVFVRMGNSPRPGLWALEKSSDYGKTFTPWQFFSDSHSDCKTIFKTDSSEPITRDDSVICTTEYSKIVPLEGGEIPISILNNRPSAATYFNSSVLQEWTRATNVRLRLLRTKSLLGHLMFVARQDPTVTRRYFYSIKDISIGGRCMCNGHADTCDIPNPKDSNKLMCRCQHDTCGAQCEKCCPGFEQKKWQQSQHWKKFSCEPCNCHNHSTECSYDPEIDAMHLSLDIQGRFEGGGVCKNCQHNTEGNNCNKCKPLFFRPHGKYWNETDACHPCDCNYHYSTGNCAEGSGQCECRKEFRPPYCDSCSYGYFGYPQCKPCICFPNATEGGYCQPVNGKECPCKYNFAGDYCNRCAEGFYNFPVCQQCQCNEIGSTSRKCEETTGICSCKNNFGGKTCEHCQAGFYNYPACDYCKCDPSGTTSEICNSTTGACLCKEGFGGSRCDQCIAGYYSEVRQRDRLCIECGCSRLGSASTSCDASGKCQCLYNFAGKRCNQCSPGYYKYPECLPCNCDSHGAVGVSCDDDGQCKCKGNFDNPQCNACKQDFYNFPACEECNCDPAGVIESFGGCGSVPAGELCQCKDRVQGRICNECRPLFWNLRQENPQGCRDCSCHLPGTQGRIGVCDSKSGLCACKHFVGERQCDQCLRGSFNLTDANVFGCTDCGCDIGGAVDKYCNRENGQCICRPRIGGRRCNIPKQMHYFPTLHQFQYEMEEGYTASGTPARYHFNNSVFPGFSWKGYAFFSEAQQVINQVVKIQTSSFYRMILRYVNRNSESVIGSIIITPSNQSETETQQTFKVLLKPTVTPQFVTVSGTQGTIPSPFVMNPGEWEISIKIPKIVFMDYMVLLPAAYYEATILTQNVTKPCEIGQSSLCRHFDYPNVGAFDYVKGEGAFTPNNGQRLPAELYVNYQQQRHELGELELPIINEQQNELLLDLTVSKPGSYVLVIEYVTPLDDINVTKNNGLINSNLTVSVRGTSVQEKSKILVNYCPFTSACRQVLTDDRSRVQVFNFQDNFLGVSIKSDPGASVAIKSVVAIPYNQWNLDYIKPQPVCIRKNGKCVQSTFITAPDSKKVEFELGAAMPIADERPQNIFDNNTDLIYLNNEEPNIDLESKVPTPGSYVFVVHYYQPDHPESELDVLIQNGQFYEARLPLQHCPSNSGCRAVIQTIDGNRNFSLTENFVLSITLKETEGKGVWLDYLLVIPADRYSDTIIKEATLDQTREFISKCGTNHFYINITDNGFCRDSVFSLTSDFNNGALPCTCDYRGALSFDCSPFGGQCDCLPNVIGRECNKCESGYYGFPDCKKCDCPPPANCGERPGECICPPNVIGEKCDRCAPLTYGTEPKWGCEQCNCNQFGVELHQLQCDLVNGSCPCKQNVGGRACDECIPGTYSFPYCYQCECDLRGTTPDICNQENANCYCKPNVIRTSCDACKDSHFDLREDNPDGCTKCFCFGKTTRCKSAELYWGQINTLTNWQLINIDVLGQNLTLNHHQFFPQLLNNTFVEAELTDNDSMNNIVYFSAPEDYLGNRLATYGGYLNFTIFYTTGLFGNAIVAGDIIVEGSGIYLIHSGIEQPPASRYWSKSFKIEESEFRTINGLPATRELLMVVLQDLGAIYIRATYWESSVTSRLQGVSMDIGTKEWNSQASLASSIEDCQCPSAYTGLSCENCAAGHYRVSTGPHGGYCVPCNCHGHSNSCDVNTGLCYDCQHNTQGDHCQLCNAGYHGNATQGTPVDCLICACPLPQISNNFASGCEVSSDGNRISCDCLEGYFGARCEACAAGYFGEPQQPGKYCQPCECSGNIDNEEPGSCDSVTGQCLHCLNNTAGNFCQLCKPGFFGDAIVLKNCQACVCDSEGIDRCDSYTGKCVCKPGVIGDKCDMCASEHYGLSSGNGCTPCNCGLASTSKQCDDFGQCRCAPGVTGTHCDRCASGFWNYSESGCITCGCNTNYSLGFGCNAETGRCECLPGVVGNKCDQCPYRYVLIPDRGCFECDSCTHGLLDSTDKLQMIIDDVLTDFKNKSSGYFTAQRQAYIRQKVDKELRPAVNQIDPDRVDLSPLKTTIDLLESDTKNLDRKAEFEARDSDNLRTSISQLLGKSEQTLKTSREGADAARAVVTRTLTLAEGLDAGQWPKLDNALAEAKQILSDMKAKDLSPQRNTSLTHLENAKRNQVKVQTLTDPIQIQLSTFEDLKDDIKNYEDNLNDMLQLSKTSQGKADTAERLNEKNRAKVSGRSDTVNAKFKEAEQDLKTAAELLANTSYTLNFAKKSVEDGTIGKDEELGLNRLVNASIDQLASDIPDLLKLIDSAETRSASLQYKSNQLKNLLTTVKNNSQTEHAVRGASAYPDITKDINTAKGSADHALKAAENATTLHGGLAEKVQKSINNSTNLHHKALEALNKVENELAPQLNQTTQSVQDIKDWNQRTDDVNSGINLALETIPVISVTGFIKNATENCNKVNTTTREVFDIMAQLSPDLPTGLNKSKELPKAVHDTVNAIALGKSQMENIDSTRPNITASLSNIQSKREIVDAGKPNAEIKLDKLRRSIDIARDLVNKIKVGIQFEPTSTLQIVTPDNVESMDTTSHISAYFRTMKDNGFLLYLGNPDGTKLRRTHSDDFMALEVENGYPVLAINIGDGPQRINSDLYVSNNKWHQVIVDRVGRSVDFTIKEEVDGEEKAHTTKRVLPGTHSIFNLDKKQSKLFVGGYPPGYKIQDDVRFSSFEGEIEELEIGGAPVGLWNFEEAHGNLTRAMARNALKNVKTSSGYRINGDGYIILDAQTYAMREASDIQLTFKTYARDGLLFLAGNGKSFISIEMREGRIFLQFRLGGNVLTIGTLDKYNDGKWHTVSASRYHSTGQLNVDGVNAGKDEAIGSQVLLIISKYIYIGGYPNKHNYIEVTNVGFDGCIDDVSITSTAVDLNQHIQSHSAIPGCPDKFSNAVSFSGDGYLKWPNASAANYLQISLKFRSKSPEGLLLYATNRDQSATISLSMLDGALVAISQKEQLTTGSNTYNDNQWHVVTITHDNTALRLLLDDFDSFSTDVPPPQVRFMYGELFFGGTPSNYTLAAGAAATRLPFSGCISDTTVNDAIINFANITDQHGTSYQNCRSTVTKHPSGENPPLIPGEDETGNEFSGDHKEPTTEEINAVTEKVPVVEKEIPTTPKTVQTPATTTAKTTKRPPPSSEDTCSLGHDPLARAPDPAMGYRFGTRIDSRIEVERLPGKYKNGYDFSVDFNTTSEGGLIFYAADKAHKDFVTLYMKDGKIYYSFNCGSGPAHLISSQVYNDGQWHTVIFSRNQLDGKLQVDGQLVAEGASQGTAGSIIMQAPFYYGGLHNASTDIKYNLQDYYAPFNGCLRNLQMRGRDVTDFREKVNVVPCNQQNEETGIYFRPQGGYLKIMGRFKVGLDTQITLEIKPRNASGLLLAVHGKNDYLVLEIIDNKVALRAENGMGEFSAYYTLGNRNSLCDGKWHSIQAIKSKNVVSVAVDGHFSAPAQGLQSHSTDTKSALFVGGHPYISKGVRGAVSRLPFVGCLRNLSIKGQNKLLNVNIPLTSAYGHVLIGMCPTD